MPRKCSDKCLQVNELQVTLLTALAFGACDNAKARPITERLLGAERHDVALRKSGDRTRTGNVQLGKPDEANGAMRKSLIFKGGRPAWFCTR